MGLKFFSSSSYDESPKKRYDLEPMTTIKVLPNPNPNNYQVLQHRQISDFLVIKIKYLDCTNYEGVKILLYKCDLKDLLKQRTIDPHFTNNSKFISPIGRFVPTQEGWRNAIMMATLLSDN